MIRHTITPKGVLPANLHLVDSYKVSKWRFGSQFKQIKAFHPQSEVWHRSIFGMELEWASHNLFYVLHIEREHTKDADLNYPRKWWEVIGYAVLGIIGLVFIK